MCRKLITLCSEDNIKNIDSLCEKTQIFNIGIGDIYNNHNSLEGYIAFTKNVLFN
jgi:hypothetical protein